MSRIDELVDAISGLSHVERPYLENLLAIKKIRMAKDPIDLEFQEAAAKVTMWETEWKNLNSWSLQWAVSTITCSLREDKDRAHKGIQKAKELLKEAEEKVQTEEEKIQEIETRNEKYSVDHRTLEVYRQEVTELLDDKKDHPDSEPLKQAIEDCKQRYEEKANNLKKLEKVKELLKEADSSILEAILELKANNMKESMMGQGKVYFPDAAYECLLQARQLYPQLPTLQSPQEYKNEKDNTGAYYSPMQKYLWDVRHKLSELILWCDNEVINLMGQQTEHQIELGQKIDEYNLFRRDKTH